MKRAKYKLIKCVVSNFEMLQSGLNGGGYLDWNIINVERLTSGKQLYTILHKETY